MNRMRYVKHVIESCVTSGFGVDMKKAMIIIISSTMITTLAIVIFKLSEVKYVDVYNEYYNDYMIRKEIVISDYYEFKELIWEIEIVIQDNGIYALEIGRSEISLGRVRLNDGYISLQEFKEQFAELNDLIQEIIGVTDIWKVVTRNDEIEFLYPDFTEGKYRGWSGSTRLTNVDPPQGRSDEFERISDGWCVSWALFQGV